MLTWLVSTCHGVCIVGTVTVEQLRELTCGQIVNTLTCLNMLRSMRIFTCQRVCPHVCVVTVEQLRELTRGQAEEEHQLRMRGFRDFERIGPVEIDRKAAGGDAHPLRMRRF